MAKKSPQGTGSGPMPKFLAWVHHHRQAALDSLEKLIRTPFSNTITILVIAIALALPTFALSVAQTASDEISQLDAPPQLSALVEAALSYEDALVLADRIERKPGVAAVTVIDRDTALAEFIDATGLETLSGRLARNPLPHTLWIYPASNLRTAGLEQLSTDLSALSGVSEVIVDSRWLARLEAFIALARSIAFALGVAMALGVILTLGNTLRLGIESRREEIVVIKLIGGGDAYVRRPFLYTGALMGFLGGGVAALLVLITLETLKSPIGQLAALYGRSSELSVFGLSNLFFLIAGGTILGLMSAAYSVQLHLARIQPR